MGKRNTIFPQLFPQALIPLPLGFLKWEQEIVFSLNISAGSNPITTWPPQMGTRNTIFPQLFLQVEESSN